MLLSGFEAMGMKEDPDADTGLEPDVNSKGFILINKKHSNAGKNTKLKNLKIPKRTNKTNCTKLRRKTMGIETARIWQWLKGTRRLNTVERMISDMRHLRRISTGNGSGTGDWQGTEGNRKWQEKTHRKLNRLETRKPEYKTKPEKYKTTRIVTRGGPDEDRWSSTCVKEPSSSQAWGGGGSGCWQAPGGQTFPLRNFQ